MQNAISLVSKFSWALLKLANFLKLDNFGPTSSRQVCVTSSLKPIDFKTSLTAHCSRISSRISKTAFPGRAVPIII
jgi:hypothetical protein